MTFSHVHIIGSGLIGSSIGLGLVQKGIEISMADIDPAAQALAQDLMKTSPSSDPDIVIIATPLGSIRQALERVDTSTV